MTKYRKEERRGFRTCRMFSDMTEIFNLTAKDWAGMLDELDALSADEREKILYGEEG